MPEPLSASSPVEAWQGRNFRVVITGRRHRNGAAFSETHPCHIERIDPDVPLAFSDLVMESLASIRHNTEIPADLILGFGIYFTEDPE